MVDWATVGEPTYTTVRKDRIDGSVLTLDDEALTYKKGPTHAIHSHNQSWCGRKTRGIATWKYDQPLSEVDCKECLKSIEQDRPRAWKR